MYFVRAAARSTDLHGEETVLHADTPAFSWDYETEILSFILKLSVFINLGFCRSAVRGT
jgi:hypothetical protein